MLFKRGTGSRYGSEEDYTLSLTPLIDVVFLLLIFFMVSTTFTDFTKRLDIELPESKAKDSIEQQNKNIVIEMDKKKRIYLDSKRISAEKLKVKLKLYSGKGTKHTVLIRADKDLSYGEVIKVMAICREANIHNIGVAVK